MVEKGTARVMMTTLADASSLVMVILTLMPQVWSLILAEMEFLRQIRAGRRTWLPMMVVGS